LDWGVGVGGEMEGINGREENQEDKDG